MVPVLATNSAPYALSTEPLPTTPIEFDGIAMFLVPSLKHFTNAFKDPYYVEVIEPDEREMLDKTGPGSGVVASFQGRVVTVVLQGESVVRKRVKGEEYRRVFEEYQEKGI
jgi:hypothetical protein